MPRQCSRISGHGARIELCRAVFRRGVADTNKLHGSEKGKAALNLIWDFYLINRKGEKRRGRRENSLPGSLEKQEGPSSNFKFLLGVVNSRT